MPLKFYLPSCCPSSSSSLDSTTRTDSNSHSDIKSTLHARYSFSNRLVWKKRESAKVFAKIRIVLVENLATFPEKYYEISSRNSIYARGF